MGRMAALLNVTLEVPTSLVWLLWFLFRPRINEESGQGTELLGCSDFSR